MRKIMELPRQEKINEIYYVKLNTRRIIHFKYEIIKFKSTSKNDKPKDEFQSPLRYELLGSLQISSLK